jgi:RNA 3'-terminal phosphate cyclase-like protein
MALGPEDVGKIRIGSLTPFTYVPSLSYFLLLATFSSTHLSCNLLLTNITLHCSIQFLRDLKKIMGVTFKMSPDRESGTIVLATVGTGFTNVNKKVA